MSKVVCYVPPISTSYVVLHLFSQFNLRLCPGISPSSDRLSLDNKSVSLLCSLLYLGARSLVILYPRISESQVLSSVLPETDSPESSSKQKSGRSHEAKSSSSKAGGTRTLQTTGMGYYQHSLFPWISFFWSLLPQPFQFPHTHILLHALLRTLNSFSVSEGPQMLPMFLQRPILPPVMLSLYKQLADLCLDFC